MQGKKYKKYLCRSSKLRGAGQLGSAGLLWQQGEWKKGL